MKVLFVITAAFTISTPTFLFAQESILGLDPGGTLSATTIQLFVLLSIISVAPGFLVMVTCFPFLVTVFSILRQAIGLQQSPPNMLIVSLSLFLTFYIMEPVFIVAWESGVSPFLENEMDVSRAFENASDPFRRFMASRVDMDTFHTLSALRQESEVIGDIGSDAPLSILVPSFMLSEISRAFQIGFLVFIPFLVIDLVSAAVLMSMGMMMVPPAIVSLPFKLAFFVVADGWTLISTSLVRGYIQ